MIASAYDDVAEIIELPPVGFVLEESRVIMWTLKSLPNPSLASFRKNRVLAVDFSVLSIY